MGCHGEIERERGGGGGVLEGLAKLDPSSCSLFSEIILRGKE